MVPKNVSVTKIVTGLTVRGLSYSMLKRSEDKRFLFYPLQAGIKKITPAFGRGDEDSNISFN
jgi:hypothetical protein